MSTEHNDFDVPDDEGAQCADLETAKEYARQLLGSNVQEEARFTLQHRIDIEDERGTLLATVYFKDVVNVER
jgi:hypothetical protein